MKHAMTPEMASKVAEAIKTAPERLKDMYLALGLPEEAYDLCMDLQVSAGMVHVSFMHGRGGRFEVDSHRDPVMTGSFPFFFPVPEDVDHG